MARPTIHDITRFPGIAGQYGYKVTVEYPDEPVETIRFYHSEYGGPVVMESPSGRQVFVSQSVTDRLGKLSPEWIRRFFA